MGCSSVYCNFSKISISGGDSVVLVPILKSNDDGIAYSGYKLFSLPIFGEYNDYQGIENIEHDISTKIIEQAFDCTIDEFCDNIMMFADVEEKIPGLRNVEYCWVLRDVWDFMIKPLENEYAFDLGSDYVLKKLGFEFIETENGKERYNKKWKFNNHIIYSDGTWIEGSIHKITDMKNKFNCDISFFKNKSSQHLFDIMPTDKFFTSYFQIFDFPRYLGIFSLKNLSKIQHEIYKEIENLEVKSLVAECITIIQNGCSFSQPFLPYLPYLTPQCGEYEKHQIMLEKFAEINKSKIYTEDE